MSNQNSLRNARREYRMTPNMRKMVELHGEKAKLPYAALISVHALVSNLASIAAVSVKKGLMPGAIADTLQESSTNYLFTIVDALADALGVTDDQMSEVIKLAQDEIKGEIDAKIKVTSMLDQITNMLGKLAPDGFPPETADEKGSNKPSDDANPSTLH